MNKILLIIKREYLTRVKKKSFIIMTIVGPLLMAGLMIVPVWMAMKEKSAQKIEVIDDSQIFKGIIPKSESVEFDYPPVTIEEAKARFYDTDYTTLLYIPSNIISGGNAVTLYYKSQPGIATEEYISSSIEKIIFDYKLLENNITPDIIKNARANIHVITKKQDENGDSEKTNTGVSMAIGFGGAILIYFFIFLYGAQIMRGVIEEKTSRIVEVIISSVKPFQLMMGKIIGIALVGLTQFVLWLVLTLTITSVVQATVFKGVDKDLVKREIQKQEVLTKGADLNALKSNQTENPSEVLEMFSDFKSIDIPVIIMCFLFYFLGGYLLYGALFAAIGSAVDNEADVQQFMLPVTIPIIFSFIIAQTVVQDPNSSLAFWTSIIPFTSPVVMMVRLPFGVPAWEIFLSMGLLILGFLFTTWLAAKIYRTGILMYGKKTSWRELGKWLFYKD